jgi:ubiquitin carboxyl-terminal hydrolase 8
MQEEILDGDNKWKCPRCQTMRRASKRTQLTRIPDLLMVHLKRFSFQGPFRDKLETMVDFPLSDLDLNPYAVEASKSVHNQYDLYAVSVTLLWLCNGCRITLVD